MEEKYIRKGIKGSHGFRGIYNDENYSSYKENVKKISRLYEEYQKNKFR